VKPDDRHENLDGLSHGDLQEKVAKLSAENAELIRANNDLSYARRLLQTILDNMPDEIYFKDAQSRFIILNWAVAKNLGVAEPSQAIGKNDFDFFPSDQAKEFFEDEQKLMNKGDELIGKIEKRTDAQGKDSWSSTTKVPMRDEDGKIVGLLGINRNITAAKEAEAKLDKAHRELMDAAHLAGMAEVATSVLHNVGNVLNSANVSALLIADKMKRSKTSAIGKAAAILREHEKDLGNFFTNDLRGKQLPEYLSVLSDHLEKEKEEILHEVDSLVDNVGHITKIVAMQQNYARAAAVLESVQPKDLVEDALRMSMAAMTRHNISLIREFNDVPPVTTDKHKVLQILVNLLRNSKYACDGSGRADKQITLKVQNGDNCVKISVEDNGIGIPQENFARLFTHGFSTRKEGHGFGLHSSVIAAKELGGSLTAFSEGVGRGAVFTLELPIST
jgi:PAS domain S-box-containing protein